MADSALQSTTHTVAVGFDNTGNIATEFVVFPYLGNPASHGANYQGNGQNGPPVTGQPGAHVQASGPLAILGTTPPGTYPLMVQVLGRPAGSSDSYRYLTVDSAGNPSSSEIGTVTVTAAAPTPTMGVAHITEVSFS